MSAAAAAVDAVAAEPPVFALPCPVTGDMIAVAVAAACFDRRLQRQAANPQRTAEEKQQQRAAARDRRRASNPGRCHVNRYSPYRAVACQEHGVRYRKVPAPQNDAQFRAAVASAPTKDERAQRLFVPDSFEVLTERR